MVVGVLTPVTGKRVPACRENGAATSGTCALKEKLMLWTSNEVLDFPIETIINNGFLQTERTDLGGLREQARKLIDLCREGGAIGGGPVGSGARSFVPRAALKRREAEQMAGEDIEGMQGHSINLFLRESQEGGEEGIILLRSEQGEVGRSHGRGKEFWLKEPVVTAILHAVCGSNQKRRKLFVWLWLNAQWEGFDGMCMSVHVSAFSSLC
jgi:hypothetical protein